MLDFSCMKEELKAVFRHWPMWVMLGTQDIKLKYRRSSLGPFWITLSMAVTITSMGYLYAHLFHMNLGNYFPYLASGLIGWLFISTLLQEGNNAFVESENYIKNQDSYMSLFLMRVILRNGIIFAHNMLVFIPIMFVFCTGIGLKTLWLIPGLLIIALNALLWGIVLATLNTRYRDFSQIITSLIQIIFFITPVMWMPTLLPDSLQWIVIYNPANQFLNLIRAPLLNSMVEMHTLLQVALVSVMGFLLCAHCLKQYKQRIVFWL